jgi:hypothetical protein
MVNISVSVTFLQKMTKRYKCWIQWFTDANWAGGSRYECAVSAIYEYEQIKTKLMRVEYVK